MKNPVICQWYHSKIEKKEQKNRKATPTNSLEAIEKKVLMETIYKNNIHSMLPISMLLLAAASTSPFPY